MENERASEVPVLRASDEDRERVATVLRDGYSHGRLDLQELQQRLDAAYAAKTMTDLVQLTADLPDAPRSQAPAAAAPGSLPAWRTTAARMAESVLTYLVIMAFLVVLWATTGADPSFWPKWPIIIGAFVLALDLIGVETGSKRRRRSRMNGRRTLGYGRSHSETAAERSPTVGQEDHPPDTV